MKLFISRKSVLASVLLAGLVISNENSYATAKVQGRKLKGEFVKKVEEIVYYEQNDTGAKSPKYSYEPEYKTSSVKEAKSSYGSSYESQSGATSFSYKGSNYVNDYEGDGFTYGKGYSSSTSSLKYKTKSSKSGYDTYNYLKSGKSGKGGKSSKGEIYKYYYSGKSSKSGYDGYNYDIVYGKGSKKGYDYNYYNQAWKNSKSGKSSKAGKSSKSGKSSKYSGYDSYYEGDDNIYYYSKKAETGTSKQSSKYSQSYYSKKGEKVIDNNPIESGKKGTVSTPNTTKKNSVETPSYPPSLGKESGSTSLPEQKSIKGSPSPPPILGKKGDTDALSETNKSKAAPPSAPPAKKKGDVSPSSPPPPGKKSDTTINSDPDKKTNVSPSPSPPPPPGKTNDTTKLPSTGKDAGKKTSSVTGFSYRMTVPKSAKKDDISNSAKKLEETIYDTVSADARERNLRYSRTLLEEYKAKEPSVESSSCGESTCDADIKSSFEVSSSGDLTSAICAMLEAIINYMNSYTANDVDGVLQVQFGGTDFSGTCANLSLSSPFNAYSDGSSSKKWWALTVLVPAGLISFYIFFYRKRRGFASIEDSDVVEDDVVHEEDDEGKN